MTPEVIELVRAAGPWLIHLATWLVARSLNMPQPLVHDTGVFVFAQVYVVEMRVGRALCPLRTFPRVIVS
ncbi:hypothetical protein H8A99_24355 [Bradyrhizobium sp. Arg68]|uniref:hypothetical protein n=1 Tax=Bradyrhizobium ivorense TaxID=2511166 RepID=UPI0027E369C2|nr:hypothetical protein [Bradyrhizobium ivorense]MCC8939522.1 hypothetical protein [Bradyrhizobium ivorense]